MEPSNSQARLSPVPPKGHPSSKQGRSGKGESGLESKQQNEKNLYTEPESGKKYLKSRLYSTQGKPFSASLKPSNMSIVKKTGLIREAKLDDGKQQDTHPLVLGKLPSPHAKDMQSGNVANDPQVEVVSTLKPLLGDTLGLHSPTSAVELGLNSPMHKQRHFFPDSMSESKSAEGETARSSQSKREGMFDKGDYEAYLQSPFSFIDKVIDNPYTEEFVYLNPEGPYNLSIVKHDQINPRNYYTMSRAGVIHFYENDADFISLNQWEREYFIFTKIMEVPFFRKFRMWKTFFFWKKFIRRQKSNSCRDLLQENLYILNPVLRGSLITLRNICWDVSKWTVFQTENGTTYSLDMFYAAQELQREVVGDDLVELMDAIRANVLKACDGDLREFLVENGFRKRSSDVGEEEDEFPQKISHAERAAIRTKCRQLTKFIRLADHFVIDTLVSLAIERTTNMLDTLKFEECEVKRITEETEAGEDRGLLPYDADEDGNQEKVPIFSVELVLEDTELVFRPSLVDFQYAVESSITSAVKKVMSVERLILDEEFAQYTRVNVEDADEDSMPEFQLEMMVFQEDKFIDTIGTIKEDIERAFVAGESYAEEFQTYLNMYSEYLSTDIESFKNSSVAEFTSLIQLYENQLAMFESMVTIANIGIIQVNTQVLKDFMVPVAERCLREVQELMPRVTAEKTKELLEEMTEANARISKIPATVDDFVAIMDFLALMQQNQDETDDRHQFISSMYKLIEKHDISVSEEDSDRFEKLNQTLQAYGMSVTFCEASVDSNTQRFSKELESDIPTLKRHIGELTASLQDEIISEPNAEANIVVPLLQEKEATLAELEATAKRYQYYQKVLDVPIIEYEDLTSIRADLDVKMTLWTAIKNWDTLTETWMDTKFSEIDTENISKEVQAYNKICAKSKRNLEEGNEVVLALKGKINEFQNTLPVVCDLRNKDLASRHWDEICSVLAHNFNDDPDFSLGTLISINAMKHKGEISVISTKASQEASLRTMLDKIVGVWSELDLIVNAYKGQKDVYVIGALDDIISALDDSLVNINTIMGSRFVEFMREEVNDWNGKLMLFQETLDEWTQCQRSWMYLESIFAAQDIVRQLPEESTMFGKIDKGWKDIMQRTNDNPNAIEAGTYKGLKETFVGFNATLERIQKKLEQYLETKRMAFPRFYFLSNDELLEILAQSKNVEAVQPHLRKCFDNIISLEFKEKDIIAMFSSEGERVPLGRNNRHTQARSSVEVWLNALESDMVDSLRRFMKKAVTKYETMPRKQFVLQEYGQMVMTVSQIMWSRGCEAALRAPDSRAALKKWYAQQLDQLTELTHLVRGNLTKIERKKLVSLVTTDVHARDVVANLYQNNVADLNDFNWQQQLRFYWDVDEDDCIVRQSNAKFNYGYEYMGVCSRLVITPLTDRCWMTITGALHIRFGAAPAGPAGTGKTESTKDLAKAMGFLCVVFNCSDQIDYKMMAKLFSGLAQCGAWTCLDEFNRIDIEVLSVIAQQLLQVRQALLQNSSSFVFEDVEMPLKDNFGVMITMNPGYAGRTELPDNLKVLFRPVAMMIPDYALIAEIMLFAEGFDSASSLSKKMVQLYKLSSEQLSQQDHYDFGMRAVKSVLVMAGALKRAEPNLTEEVVLIRAMRDSNVPKFLAEDLPLFHAIVNDLFPGVNIPTVDYGELEVAVRECITEEGLQPVPDFVSKVIQLYDTFNVRFGVMIVGPTGGGKTECYNILAKALTKLKAQGGTDESYQTIHTHVLNPKCITMGELYGEIDSITQEWTDGLGSTIMREAIKDNSSDRHWCVFDGPVDALWIENMNTVLDDNMTLCLANGERIKLKSELRMLFEVQDLAVASPATVSRCGMVYMTPDTLGYMPYVQSWIPRLPSSVPENAREHLLSLFTKKMGGALDFIREKCFEPIKTVNTNLVASCCAILESHLNREGTDAIDFTQNEVDLLKTVETLFTYAVVWSVGGAIQDTNHVAFSDYISENFPTSPPGHCYDFFVKIEEHGCTWMKWETIVPAFNYNPETPFFRMIVPTVDTVRYSTIVETLLDVDRSVFFTGTTGIGKSCILSDMLNTRKVEKNYVPFTIMFSAQTNARKTQETIESKLVKLRKNQLGAPAGKRLIILVDDVNMPAVEEYGAQPPIELLRQFQDYKGFYDRKKLFWKNVQDTTLVCAAGPPGGGRSEITPRFVRHFSMFCLPEPSEGTMEKIFSSILGGFLSSFKPDVQSLCSSIVSSTVQLYTDISAALLPTPSKSHYTFNLRDISKVFMGLLMVKPTEIPNADVFTRLWIHESMRCFHDRLISQEDRLWFTNQICSLLKRKFSLSWTHEELFEKEPIMFVDYIRPEEDIYEQSPGIDKLSALLSDYLEEYNMTSSNPMKLVFFRDAILHISRISRILRQPRGNAMLVGVGGSGKQSLTRLACAISDVKCLQMEITRGFGYSDFQDFLKQLMTIAGVEGKQVAFLFTDNQILEERFLEDVNNILNSGEVPNLFATDEMLKVIEDMGPVVKELGLPESREVIYATFVERVRSNLHIILCMSPVGDSFRVRCRKFPSLINCTTIDWFTQWPREALMSVSRSFLKDVQLPSDEMREALAELCVEVHLSLEDASDRFFAELRRKVYTTPKSYLDLIGLYLAMLQEKRDELNSNRKRLSTGLRKLKETNEIVAELQETLVKLQPELVEKAKETEILLKQVAVDQEKAAKVRHVVEAEEKVVKAQASEVSAIQADAQADLDLALPALEAAVHALDSLKKSDISEVKSMLKPPDAVVMVMEAVCILLGEKADWETAKKVMANAQFLKILKDFDKDNISPKTVQKLQKYVTKPNFTEDAMKKVSIAATSLCLWVKAMVVYSQVAKEVEPKKQKVAEMNALLNEANAKLAEKQSQLDEVTKNVAALQKKCDDTVMEKKRLDIQSQTTKDRLERAGKLTTGLADEAVRWALDAEAIGKDLEFLVGDVFLSAACISYSGAFTGEYRKQLITKWHALVQEKAVPVSEVFKLRVVMGNEVQVRQWNIHGLPTDDVSVDNGIMVTRGQRWPLMIDPQGQAKKWIKNEYKSKLVVTRFGDPNLLRTLEGAIRNGLPVLIEDVGEELDASVDPILMKQTFTQGARVLIRLGENDVDYDPNFRFFMTTKMPNPHYLPEVCIKVTLLNFTVTRKGLEDQLLGDVVRKERPDIEDKKNRLVVSMAADKKQLKDIEVRILKMLSESSGNILDDIDLIATLGDSKFTSNVIKQRMVEAVTTQKDINEIREQYRPAAVRGSILYFVMSDLALIDPMYQYSLSYFKRLFELCIDQSEKSDDLTTRLSNLMEFMTSSVFMNVCRGLFESHKLLYSFLICSEILKERGDIDLSEWNFLLRGGPLADSSTALENCAPDVFTAVQWKELTSLVQAVPDTFADLATDISDSVSEWTTMVKSDAPHQAPLPGRWEKGLTHFQKLLVLKVFRPEKVLFACAEFVSAQLGREFIEPQSTKLEDVYKDTDFKTPIIFVLSTGADPTGILLRFAKQRDYTERLQTISLGQGQGDNARRLIEQAVKNGDWVLLQNCHLAKSWMPDLEKIVDSLADGDIHVHEDFRLWLTSMPCSYFPVSVLQTGVKLTNEPPKGLRANLLRSFRNVVNADEFETCSTPQPWKKLLYGLCFFHATIQERKKFGPLGWNKMYEFNDSDLETSMQVLRMFLEEQEDIPWDALRYVCGQINYGGRVTDDWDRRCLMSILDKFYTPSILKDEYVFSESGTYKAPSEGDLQSFIKSVERLPLEADPEIFGMHENANITFQKNESNTILSTILSVQPRLIGTGGGKTPDELVSELAALISEQLPPLLDRRDAGANTFVEKENGVLDSLATTLLQEMERFNRLLSQMKSSLSELQRAIRGEVIMSSELDKMYSALLNNEVPDLWTRVAYPSLKPLASWVQDLLQRVTFMTDWLKNGQPKSFWLSGFFFPQGFLTGALQNYARKYQVPIDTLSFRFEYLDEFNPEDLSGPPEDGVYIHGLFMDGARWDVANHCVEDSNLGELYPRLPIIHFIPTRDHVPNPKHYQCPIYKTSVRAGILSTTGQSTNFVLAIELPTSRDPNYWVLKGAASLCQLNV